MCKGTFKDREGLTWVEYVTNSLITILDYVRKGGKVIVGTKKDGSVHVCGFIWKPIDETDYLVLPAAPVKGVMDRAVYLWLQLPDNRDGTTFNIKRENLASLKVMENLISKHPDVEVIEMKRDDTPMNVRYTGQDLDKFLDEQGYKKSDVLCDGNENYYQYSYEGRLDGPGSDLGNAKGFVGFVLRLNPSSVKS